MHRQAVHIEHMPAAPAPAHAGTAVQLRADDQERINRALRDARAPKGGQPDAGPRIGPRRA